MPRAKLDVDLPGNVWVARVSSAYPGATVRVLAALPSGETGVGLVEVAAPDPDAVLAAMDEQPDVTSVRRLGESPGRVLVQFETTRPLLLFSMREAGVPLEPPVEIRDGTATVEVTASRDDLSALADQLEGFGMDYEVVYVRHAADTRGLLTARQRDVLRAAVEAGYYDTPRATTLSDLADDLGVAKSTLSETLHRAEGTVLKEFAETLPGTDAE